MPLGAFRLNSLSRYIAAAAASRTTVTVNGDAQIDTAQSKFGGASAKFDGSGDYLEFTTDQFDLSGNFTIEFWLRLNTTSNLINILHNRTGGDYSPGNFTLNVYNGLLRLQGDDFSQLEFYVGSNTWYHVSINRSGSDLNLKLNGSNSGSSNFVTTYSGTFGFASSTWYIGAADGGSSGLSGYIDELRVSNTARYSASIPFGSFTPSSTPFVNDENTLLLLHMDGTDGSTDFPDDVS